MRVQDRPKVKLECLRLVAGLKLAPARSKLIGGFIDSYLQLTAQELTRYKREFEKLAPAEKESTMTLVSSWEQKGISQGISQGKETLVVRQLRRRLGAISDEVTIQLAKLSPAKLDNLGEALLECSSPSDLEQWFARN